MPPKSSLFFLVSISLLAALFLSYPAAATDTTITFSDLNIIKGMDILVYNATESGMVLIGEYNSTQTVTLNSTSYIFALKPTSQSLFTSPQGTIDLLGAYLPITMNYLITGLFIVGIAYAVSRLWK